VSSTSDIPKSLLTRQVTAEIDLSLKLLCWWSFNFSPRAEESWLCGSHQKINGSSWQRRAQHQSGANQEPTLEWSTWKALNKLLNCTNLKTLFGSNTLA